MKPAANRIIQQDFTFTTITATVDSEVMLYYDFEVRGKSENPDSRTLSTTLIPRELFTAKGYTGHEMLDAFEIINMNGRIYDPVIARFFSPDPYVQAPQNPQNLNRYSYCLNNPLVYTDPSGEIFGAIFTAYWDLGTTIFTKGGLEFWNSDKDYFQDAWRDFDPSAEWSKTNKAMRIDRGLIKTDENRSNAGRALQFASRFTWELPQTIVGNLASHTRNVAGSVDNVDYYGGATLVNDDDPSAGVRWGFTLGPYINSENIVADPNVSDIFRHEYGHSLQSRLFGPLYLTHVGLPSLIGSGLEDIGINDHSREWYETQANRMAFRYFNNHDNGALTTLSWNDNDYPREYNPNWYWMFAHPPLPFMWWLFF